MIGFAAPWIFGVAVAAESRAIGTSVLKMVKAKAKLLRKAPTGSVAVVASARQTNEELFLLKKLGTKLGALTNSIAREGEAYREPKVVDLLTRTHATPFTEGAFASGNHVGAEVKVSADPELSATVRPARSLNSAYASAPGWTPRPPPRAPAGTTLAPRR